MHISMANHDASIVVADTTMSFIARYTIIINKVSECTYC